MPELADDPDPVPADDEALHRLLATAPFAVLATHGASGRLDLVPCCFTLDTSTGQVEVVTAIDHKPKRRQRLARLDNINRDPNATLLVDHRDPDDWSQLWWVRIQGTARVINTGPDHTAAIAALCQKYPQYQAQPPHGPAIRLTPTRWTHWFASIPPPPPSPP